MVSIVIPVRPNDEHIDFCIKAILKSTFKEYEIIIVLDGWNTPIIKINAYQPLFDNADTFLKEKHRQSLDFFTKIVFTHHENKIRVERVLSQSIKSKIVLEESNSITISESKANENEIKIY